MSYGIKLYLVTRKNSISDCYHFYWHDLRKEKEWYKTRQSDGGSSMIWAGMSASGKTKLVFLQGKQDSVAYYYTIETYLFPYAHLHYSDDYVFQ
jgi:hypothetical protein